MRTLYVIVPDLALKLHYQRLGFEIDHGCRVLLDAEALLPIAVLRLSLATVPGRRHRLRRPPGSTPTSTSTDELMQHHPAEVAGSRVQIDYRVELHYDIDGDVGLHLSHPSRADASAGGADGVSFRSRRRSRIRSTPIQSPATGC